MFTVDVPLGTKSFKTIVEARAYAVKQINDDPLYILDIYETKQGKKAKLVGNVTYSREMGYYYSIPSRKDQFTGEQYYRSRPIYKNGKLAGRF